MTQQNHGPSGKPGDANQQKPAAQPHAQSADAPKKADDPKSVTTAASSVVSKADQARADAWDAAGSRSPGSLPPQMTEVRDSKSASPAKKDPVIVQTPASGHASASADTKPVKRDTVSPQDPPTRPGTIDPVQPGRPATVKPITGAAPSSASKGHDGSVER